MRKHIYIIEDDAGILEGLTFLLEKNYQVTAISDARIALRKLQSEHPDLILLDLLMPDFSGTAFIEALLQQQLKIPIILMTACSNTNVKQSCSAIVGVIRKPFQIEQIETKIKQVMNTPTV